MHTFRLVTAAVFATTLAGAALAQQGPQTPGRAAPDRAAMCKEHDAHMAGRLAYAEARLNLTDAQKAGWKKLTDTITQAHEPARKLCLDQAAQPEPTALPARLEQMQKRMEAHTEAMRKVVPAITQFYGTLTPDQQKTADEIMNKGRHGGQMGYMGHGHMGHMGGMGGMGGGMGMGGMMQ